MLLLLETQRVPTLRRVVEQVENELLLLDSRQIAIRFWPQPLELPEV
jgi:hypothetical protein